VEDELAARDAEIAGLRTEVEQLRALVNELVATVEELRVENAELKARLGENSSNSSKPPSSDGYAKPTRQQRRAADRKAGKQRGTPGHHLARVDNPDEVIVHEPLCCEDCGSSLHDAEFVNEEVRQVFDLPPRKIVVREHRAVRRRCHCDHETKALFPPEAINVTCYGPQVRALAVYLTCTHHLPFDRAALVMSDICGLSISVGSVVNMVKEAAGGLDDFAIAVREALRGERLVHFDETGARVSGKLFWVHSASTEKLTAYIVHANRGGKAMDDMGLLSLKDEDGKELWSFDGIAMHDGWRSYRAYDVVHALCNAHHLRELKAAGVVWNQTWALEMIELLRSSKQTVERAKTQGQTTLDASTYHGILSRYGKLVKQGFEVNPKRARRKQSKTYNLLVRLDEYRQDVLRFASNFDAPFDNNQAERDIRMVKLQQKISGCWRTFSGAQHFLRVREYLSTARKQGQQAIDVLHALFEGKAWMPVAVQV
jgi:transposase